MTATTGGSVVPAGQKRVFVYLLAALLLETLFFVVLSPLLPVYSRELHLTRVAAGVMSASYSVGYGLASVPAGALVGVLSRRVVSIGGLVLVATSCAAFALGSDVVFLDASRALTGAGAAAVWAGSIPWLVSLGGDEDRGRLIGLAFSAASAGACVGPAVGALATLIGARTAFLALSGVILVVAGTGAVVSRGGVAVAAGDPKRALRNALRAPDTRRVLAVAALPSLSFGVAGVLLPLRLHALGVAEVLIAAAYLVAALLEAIVNALVGRWFDRRGAARVLRVTLMMSAVCVAVIALPLPAWLLLSALALSLPVLGSVWVPSLAALAASVQRTGTQSGVALGLFNITWAICQIAGALGGPQLVRLGEAVPFVTLGVLYVLGMRAAGRAADGAVAQPR
jgi:predicted MFS family arabinose efflux permease